MSEPVHDASTFDLSNYLSASRGAASLAGGTELDWVRGAFNAALAALAGGSEADEAPVRLVFSFAPHFEPETIYHPDGSATVVIAASIADLFFMINNEVYRRDPPQFNHGLSAPWVHAACSHVLASLGQQDLALVHADRTVVSRAMYGDTRNADGPAAHSVDHQVNFVALHELGHWQLDTPLPVVGRISRIEFERRFIRHMEWLEINDPRNLSPTPQDASTMGLQAWRRLESSGLLPYVPHPKPVRSHLEMLDLVTGGCRESVGDEVIADFFALASMVGQVPASGDPMDVMELLVTSVVALTALFLIRRFELEVRLHDVTDAYIWSERDRLEREVQHREYFVVRSVEVLLNEHFSRAGHALYDGAHLGSLMYARRLIASARLSPSLGSEHWRAVYHHGHGDVAEHKLFVVADDPYFDQVDLRSLQAFIAQFTRIGFQVG